MTPEARFILDALDFRMPMLLRNVQPLSEDQLRWIPGPGQNHIAWQLWHIAEVEDNWPRTSMLSQPPRFPFGQPLDEADRFPPSQDLLDYLHKARALTRDRLHAMSPEDFDRTITEPDFGDMTIRQLWAGVVTSFAWHAGQIALTAKLIPDTPVTTWTFTGWKNKQRQF